MSLWMKSLSCRYISLASVGSSCCNTSVRTRDTDTEGLKMNHDHIIIFSMILGSIIGFAFGYIKGHENGIKQARRSYRRLTRQLEQHQVSR